MAAPAVAAVVALLTGAGGVATAPSAIALIRGEQVVSSVYADLPAICSATDPLIDALGDAYPNSIELRRVVRAADLVCSAANRANALPNLARIVPAAIVAIKAAAAKVGAASSEPAANGGGVRGRAAR
jgi:hypothetical protein